jgi:hypothetical protein
MFSHGNLMSTASAGWISCQVETARPLSVASRASPAVRADATSGTGIEASCVDGHALTATSSSMSTTEDAVTIDYAGRSRALYAELHGATHVNGIITCINDGHGIGLWGEHCSDTGTGFGLVGSG